MAGGTALALATVALANPFVGTSAQRPDFGVFGYGSTFPGAVAPFGMVQWTPYTDPATPGGYDYAVRRIAGFPLTALSGGGCAAYGDVSFMPTPGGAGAAFTHVGERARPGYYRVFLGSPATRVDLTASARAGMARITYPGGVRALTISPTARLGGATGGPFRRVGRRAIEGRVTGGDHCGRRAPYRLWFRAEFDHRFRRVSPSELRFGARRVQVRAAISYVSAAGARRNLRSAPRDFDAMRRATARAWARLLGRVRVRGGSRADRTRLYTALYHSFIYPTLFSDAGRRRGYTNVSGWDAYRSWAPLLAVLAPGVGRDLAAGLTDTARRCGAVPQWLLANRDTGAVGGDGGAHTLAVLDAFGVRGYPRRAALHRMVRAAEVPGRRCGRVPARPGLRSYLDLGFIPADEPALYGPTSTTLEYASTDFALATMARRLGARRAAGRLLARAGAWRRLFDPASGLIRPRLRDGRPSGGDETLGPSHFVEGNAHQYTWLVPHDLRGLIAAMGGPARADARLDALLAQLNAGLDAPHAFLGNEPSLLLPWIHNWTGAPWKTQDTVRRALTELYPGGPAGIPGNDDQGALSSWSVWAALGLYPAIPGRDGLTVGSPLFRRVSITLPRGRRLTIATHGSGPYVQGLRLGRRRISGPWLRWRDLRRGGTLRFSMGPRPSGWGSATPPP